MLRYYILFENYTDGLAFESALKNLGKACTISPTPRILSKCCGISIMIKKDEIDEVRNVLVNFKNSGLYSLDMNTKKYEKLA